jgi:hypothetical protein
VIGAEVARQAWRRLEPIHGMIYFVPEARARYEAIGLRGSRMGYFASRAAALGPVPAEVVIATFFNFNPVLVRRSIPDAWGLAPIDRILEARLQAVDDALRRALADKIGGPEVAEAADLARRAALAACEHPEGRPLFAAHASLAWPDEDHLVLWHAQTLLREFRGDAHVAALLLERLTGIGALVSHAAAGDVPAAALQASRAWPDDDWAAAVEDLRGRGLVAPGDDLVFTDAGRAQRDRIEAATTTSTLPAYAALGEEGTARLGEVGRHLSRAVVAAGLLAVDPSVWTEEA